MKLNDFNIFIGTLIVSNILDTESYAALRQCCKFFYFLMPEVKRFTNFQITQIIKFKNHVVDGEVTCYYPSGKIKSVALYEQGMIVTKHVCWDENGIISIKNYYKNNKKNGKQEYFSEHGHLIKTIDYKDGVPHGKEIQFYNSGLIKNISNYTRGKRNGMLIAFDEYGQKIMTKNYSLGYLSGEMIIYHSNGEIKQQTNYSLGIKNGICAVYDKHGNPMLELNYKRYLMGKIYYECNYINNLLDGPATIFNYGEIEFETYFNKGQIEFYHREYTNKLLSLNVVFDDKKRVVVCKKQGDVLVTPSMYEGIVYWQNIMEKYKTILKNKLDISYIID